MTATASGTSVSPPGPQQRFDINIAPDSFGKIQELVATYGDICRVRGEKRSADSFIVNEPNFLKHILLTNYANYNKGVGFERVKLLLGNGIIVSDGSFWRRQRRMIQPAFSKAHIERMTDAMCSSNERCLTAWQTKADTGEELNLSHAVSELSLEIILQALFSEDLAPMIERQGENPFAFFADDSVRDLQVAVKFRALGKLILALIDQRRNEDRRTDDILGALMAARDKDSNEPMTDKEILDEVMTMIVAGHETSACTLNWAWYLISQHPEVEAKLHAEVDALDGRTPNFADLPNLTYTRQILEETLRLYPPVWLFSRRALQADQLGPYTIPAGSDIFIAPYFLHRREDLWPNPEAFNPDRFSPEATKAQHRFGFIPFSAGPRRCIGDFFGLVEMQIHLGLLAQHLRLRYVDKGPIELEPAVNLRSKYSLFMTIESR